MQAGFRQICDTVGLPRTPLLHMQNKGTRPNYRDHYTPETRDRVATLFARTIDHFGYVF